MLQNPTSLASKVLKSKYFKNRSPLSVTKPKQNSSWFWKGLWKGIKIIQDEAVWKIGNDTDIELWNHNWIPLNNPNTITRNDIKPTITNTLTKVSNVFNSDTKEWNENFLNQVLPQRVVQNILGIKLIQNSPTKDILTWLHTRKGDLTFKSVYEFLIKHRPVNNTHPPIPPHHPVWRKIRSLNVLPRVKVFVWKCYSGVLPVSCKIGRWVHTVNTTCSMCNSCPETEEHTFFKCPFSRDVWFGVQCIININVVSVQLWIESWIHNTNPSHVPGTTWNQLYALTAWHIWKARCLKCFQKKQQTPAATINLITNHIQTSNNIPLQLHYNRNPNPGQLEQLQTRKHQTKLTMICYSCWITHAHTVIIINVLTDEQGTAKGRWACHCAVLPGRKQCSEHNCSNEMASTKQTLSLQYNNEKWKDDEDTKDEVAITSKYNKYQKCLKTM